MNAIELLAKIVNRSLQPIENDSGPTMVQVPLALLRQAQELLRMPRPEDSNDVRRAALRDW